MHGTVISHCKVTQRVVVISVFFCTMDYNGSVMNLTDRSHLPTTAGTLGVFHLLTWLSMVLGSENLFSTCWTIRLALNPIWFSGVIFTKQCSSSLNYISMPNFQHQHKMSFDKFQWTNGAEKSLSRLMTRGQITSKICLELCMSIHSF